MTVQLPTIAQLRDVAKQCGLSLADADLESFRGLMAGSVGAYNIVDAMPDEVPRVVYPRTPGYRPGPEENPRNAWYRKTSVKGAPSGKLKGKRIALKDNVMLAGVPMMNGAATLEGFIPEFDAPIASRMLDEGAEIIGKTHCESFCLSGGVTRTQRARCIIRIRWAIRPAVLRREVQSLWRSAKPTWRSVVTRAARSACRPHSPASAA